MLQTFLDEDQKRGKSQGWNIFTSNGLTQDALYNCLKRFQIHDSKDNGCRSHIFLKTELRVILIFYNVRESF